MDRLARDVFMYRSSAFLCFHIRKQTQYNAYSVSLKNALAGWNRIYMTLVLVLALLRWSFPMEHIEVGLRTGVFMFVGSRLHDRYLVDPASSHMLVSKTKPCMSKYKYFIF